MDSSIIPDLNTLIAGETVMKFLGNVALNLSSGIVSSLSVRVGKQLKKWAVGKKITEQELQEKIELYNQTNKRGLALFREHIKQACLQLAREMEREKSIPETDVRYPLLRLLGDSTFHQAITNWVLTADPEQKQVYKQGIQNTLKNQCAAFDTDPATLQKLSGAMDQIEEELYNDPLLSRWYQGIQMSYVVKSVASLQKGTAAIQKDTASIREAQNEQRGIYSQDVLDAVLHEYCETVSKQFETISDLTAKNELPLPLDEFFMPLSLQVEGGSIATLEEMDWLSSPWLILGNAGDGKSTTFRWLVHRAFQDWKKKQDCLASGLPVPYQDMMFQGKLPVPILCRNMHMEKKDTTGKILTDYMITMKWVDEGEYADVRNAPLYKAIWREMKAGGSVLLIDGLDELKERGWQEHYYQSQQGKLLEELISHIQYYGNNSLVVSSRPSVLRLLSDNLRQNYRIGNLVPPKENVKVVMIKHWVDRIYSDDNHYSENERTRYKKTLVEAVTDGSTISSLTDSPLMLSMLLIAFKSDGKIPSMERELYEKAVSELIFRGEENHFQFDTKRDKLLKSKERRQKSILAQLEYLAVEMCIKGVQRLEVSEVEEMLGNFRDQLQKTNSGNKLDLSHEIEDFLLYLQENSGLFFPTTTVENNGEEEIWWEFRHLVFQDYLAACAIYHGYYIRDGKSLSIVEFAQKFCFDLSGKFMFEFQYTLRKIVSLVQSFYPEREERNEILARVDSLFVFCDNIFDNFIPQWEGTKEELIADFYKNARVACAKVLSYETGEDVTAALLKGMGHNHSHVRRVCGCLLGNKTGENVTAALLKGLHDDDGAVRIACATSLKNKMGEAVTIALMKGLSDDDDSAVRIACARSLENKIGENVTAALLKGLNDDKINVRMACATLLKNKMGEAVTAALLKSLNDDDALHVRVACAFSLGNKTGENVISALLKGLDDNSYHVRNACAFSLKNKTGEDVTAILLKGLGNGTKIRIGCIRILAYRGGSDVINALTQLAKKTSDLFIRDACLESLDIIKKHPQNV